MRLRPLSLLTCAAVLVTGGLVAGPGADAKPRKPKKTQAQLDIEEGRRYDLYCKRTRKSGICPSELANYRFVDGRLDLTFTHRQLVTPNEEGTGGHHFEGVTGTTVTPGRKAKDTITDIRNRIALLEVKPAHTSWWSTGVYTGEKNRKWDCGKGRFSYTTDDTKGFVATVFRANKRTMAVQYSLPIGSWDCDPENRLTDEPTLYTEGETPIEAWVSNYSIGKLRSFRRGDYIELPVEIDVTWGEGGYDELVKSKQPNREAWTSRQVIEGELIFQKVK